MEHSLSLATFHSSLPHAKSRYPSKEAAQRLSDHIADVLPGVQLDIERGWLVFPSKSLPNGKYDSCIINPGLRPLGTFRSRCCVSRFLQQLQQQGLPLPGVIDANSSGSSPGLAGNITARAAAALVTEGPDQEQAKAIAAVLRRLGPVEYRLVDTTIGQHAAQAKQQANERKVQLQGNGQSTADACRGDQTQRKPKQAPARMCNQQPQQPCKKRRRQLPQQQQQQLDQFAGQTPLPIQQKYMDLNQLQGTTWAAAQPQQQQQQQTISRNAARQHSAKSSSKRSTGGPSSAANAKPLRIGSSGRKKATAGITNPRKQQQQRHGGSSASAATAKAAGTSRQKTGVKAVAGQKRGRQEQQQQQQQRKKRKHQATHAAASSEHLKQRQSWQQPESSTTGRGSLALPDGRLPCPAALKQLTAFVSVQLPGAVLDARWRVYPSSAMPNKKDIEIRHPDLPQGKFRSSKAVAVCLSTVVGELDRRGISRQAADIPGLETVPAGGDAAEAEAQAVSEKGGLRQSTGTGSSSRTGSLQQRALQGPAGPSKLVLPPEVLLAGLRAAAGGFIFQGSGNSRRGSSRPGAQPQRRGLAIPQTWTHPPIDASYSLPKKGPVLVLAMFFASAGTAAEGDQGYASHRDRARLLQLQQGLGYRAYSFDLDHAEAEAEGGQHVQGNFNSHRGARDVAARFAGVEFSAIFLDYFRVPSGYAAVLYKPQLFTQFIPELVKVGAAAPGVRVYIPNNEALLKQLAGNGAFGSYSSFRAVPGSRYPLYIATAQAEASGDLGGEYSNSSEVRELVEGSEFVVMRWTGGAPAAVAPVVRGGDGVAGGTGGGPVAGAGGGPVGAAGASEGRADGSATAASAAVAGAP